MVVQFKWGFRQALADLRALLAVGAGGTAQALEREATSVRIGQTLLSASKVVSLESIRRSI